MWTHHKRSTTNGCINYSLFIDSIADRISSILYYVYQRKQNRGDSYNSVFRPLSQQCAIVYIEMTIHANGIHQSMTKMMRCKCETRELTSKQSARFYYCIAVDCSLWPTENSDAHACISNCHTYRCVQSVRSQIQYTKKKDIFLSSSLLHSLHTQHIY